MKKIAFKNFRRFQDFPMLELGNISIMVGRNNSGKSTMVKALLLVLDYLQNQQHNEFSFTNNSLENANIVTFGRAKNNKSESNEIIFNLELDSFFISLFIYGDDEDTNVNVSKLTITDDVSKIYYEINYIQKTIRISKKNSRAIEADMVSFQALKNELIELKIEINKNDFKKNTSEGLRILDRFNNLNEKQNDYLQNFEKEKGSESNLFNITYPLKQNIENKTEDTFLQEFISDFIFLNDAEIKKLKTIRNNYAHNTGDFEDSLNELFINDKNNDEEYNKQLLQKLEEKIQELVDIDNYKSDLTKSINNVVKAIKAVQIYYLGANPSKQSALFSIRDKQNNLAQAIHDFKQSKILKGEKEYEFVKHWMQKFEVGFDFHIEFYAGEAYEFYIFDEENKKAHLADKGMGSLQAMMLILRVATILRKHKNNLVNITVIVEEPELNLHPALQGELAKFFHDVNKEYHINFIIETHSEYLIRKSQNIIVKEEYTNDEGLNPHPFKLHYFDVENGPYEMKFLENGKFDRKFGKGFFDYSDELEVETYKLNLKKNK
jgi:predicted ATPase